MLAQHNNDLRFGLDRGKEKGRALLYLDVKKELLLDSSAHFAKERKFKALRGNKTEKARNNARYGHTLACVLSRNMPWQTFWRRKVVGELP